MQCADKWGAIQSAPHFVEPTLFVSVVFMDSKIPMQFRRRNGLLLRQFILILMLLGGASCAFAQDVSARLTDWNQNRASIMARIDGYISRKEWKKANLLAKDYLIVAADVMRPIIKDTKINELREDLAKTKATDHETRIQILRELAVLDRQNPKWDSQLAAARKASEAADKARRRKEGVRIGMSMDDVKQSSWGRPRRVNRTTTVSGATEQWVYDGGYLYFTDGVLTAIQN